MIVHDERGIIEDLSEIEYVKFRKSKILQTKTFESYYSEIRPILNYLQNCEGFESIIGKVIEMWDGHQAKARLLQEQHLQEQLLQEQLLQEQLLQEQLLQEQQPWNIAPD
jgi:hypothetical protein